MPEPEVRWLDGPPTLGLDLETTSKDTDEARIVQVTIEHVHPERIEVIDTLVDTLVDPGEPITEEAQQVHGITDEDVQDAPSFALVQHEHDVQALLDEAERVVAYHGGFDLEILDRELRRLGHDGIQPGGVELVDPYPVFREHLSHSLEDAHEWYLGEELEDAHDSKADTRGAVRVLQAQLDDVDGHPETVEDAITRQLDWAGKIVLDDEDRAVFAFGKHEGEPVVEHESYADWVLSTDFPESTKSVVRDLLEQHEEAAPDART